MQQTGKMSAYVQLHNNHLAITWSIRLFFNEIVRSFSYTLYKSSITWQSRDHQSKLFEVTKNILHLHPALVIVMSNSMRHGCQYRSLHSNIHLIISNFKVNFTHVKSKTSKKYFCAIWLISMSYNNLFKTHSLSHSNKLHWKKIYNNTFLYILKL